MATVYLPRSLVTLFNDPPPPHLEVGATSLADLVARLDATWPGMRDRLCEPGPAIREHINVFIDGERQRDLATALAPEAVVHIIPAVAGGRAQGSRA
jgi:molybdopterin converting factor small subunit